VKYIQWKEISNESSMFKELNYAKVFVDQKVVGQIEKGYLLYVGIHVNDE
jgi:D-Tyr-tRNAtyr deacylase